MRTGILMVAVLVAMGCTSLSKDEGMGGLAATMEVRVGGDSVHMILHVTNESTASVPFTFPSSQRYDFTVTTMAGERIWQWSSGMSFMQVITEAELGAGETWTFEESWNPGAREGTYVARGEITARNREVVQQTTFELR